MSQFASPAMMNLLLAQMPQPGQNPPLSQDPNVEARGNRTSQTRTDVPAHRTMTSATAGRGAGPRVAAQQALGGNTSNGSGTYDTGNTTEIQNAPGWTPAAGILKNNQPATPWNVQIGRGMGANQEQETTTFQKGQAPQYTEQGTPEQQRQQQEALQVEGTKHPSQAPRYNADRDSRMFDALGKEIEATHKQIADYISKVKMFNPDANVEAPKELTGHLNDLMSNRKTLGDRLIKNEGYDTPYLPTQAGDMIQGPAGEQQPTTQPTAQTQAPKPYQPGNPVAVGDVVTVNGQTGRIDQVDAQGNPTHWTPQ